MDTHKEFTEVAYSLDGRNNEVIHLGRIPSTKQGLLNLARQFQSKYPHATLHFLYEAGPCGYWMYRLLSQQGHCCYLVAPSLTPKKPRKGVKTDKRDAMDLCPLLKNGDISPIYVPETSSLVNRNDIASSLPADCTSGNDSNDYRADQSPRTFG